MAALATQLAKLASLIKPYSKPGWLLYMACNVNNKQELVAAHNDLAKTVGVRASAPSARLRACNWR